MPKCKCVHFTIKQEYSVVIVRRRHVCDYSCCKCATQSDAEIVGVNCVYQLMMLGAYTKLLQGRRADTISPMHLQRAVTDHKHSTLRLQGHDDIHICRHYSSCSEGIAPAIAPKCD
eukprot:16101-Heterococcus_DN1.PRE.4